MLLKIRDNLKVLLFMGVVFSGLDIRTVIFKYLCINSFTNDYRKFITKKITSACEK